MKKTLITTVALAVLLPALVSQAAITIEVTKNADPAAGLSSYTLTAVSDVPGVNIVTFSDIHINGNVHHVWPILGTRETPNIGDWAEDTYVDPSWAAYDTFLLIPAGDILTEVGDPLTETNDFSNPAGLALTKTLDAYSGEGTYGHGPNASSLTLLLAAHATEVEFLHVVIYGGGEVTLDVGIVDSNVEKTSFEGVGIPEPATLALLVLGSTGLVARRRKDASFQKARNVR